LRTVQLLAGPSGEKYLSAVIQSLTPNMVMARLALAGSPPELDRHAVLGILKHDEYDSAEDWLPCPDQ